MIRSTASLLVALVVALSQQSGQDRTAIFVCGEDETIPPIPVDWTSVVLAGDGRLFSPCPGGNHARDHREAREAALIGEARYSRDAEIRWRAAQAMARNSARPQAFPTPGWGNPPRMGTREFTLAQVDGLGGIVPSLTVDPSCGGGAQLFDDPTARRVWQPGRLFFMLQEFRGGAAFSPAPVGTRPPPEFFAFRRRTALEGVYAIGALLSRQGLDANLVTAVTKELRGCYTALPEPNAASFPEIASVVLENLGLAPYGSDAEMKEAEDFLVQESHGGVFKILGAVKGLEALIRQHPQRQIGDNTRTRLRQLVTYGARTGQPLPLDNDARIRRLALLALQGARDRDPATLRQAATDGDWQLRRLVAGSLNFSDPEMAAIGELLAADTAFQVRYELLSPISRVVAQTHDCAPIVARLDDASPIVVMRAMDLLTATCSDLDDVTRKFIELAGRLGNVNDDKNWHTNSRALTTLARMKPNEARPFVAAAVKMAVWQVRAAAAATSGPLADEASAVTLARDPEPNVQTAALNALRQMRSASVVPLAIEALRNGADNQLLRTAALVLDGLPADARDDASDALLVALRKLTAQETDTSRDPRVAILNRLAETLNPARSSDLQPFVGDYDEGVNEAVTKAYTAITNAPPVVISKRARYPYQPPASALSSLPSEASIQLESGTVSLRLLSDVAPVTVARFAALVTRGYYNGLTFHRIAPNFVVQGGSPGANEYSGTSRYMRDEVGPLGVHVRGAVGISTRGRDTGDGQIFIDLVDLPRLDRDYTVFAYVTQGMELIDRLLEGAKIVTISVK